MPKRSQRGRDLSCGALVSVLERLPRPILLFFLFVFIYFSFSTYFFFLFCSFRHRASDLLPFGRSIHRTFNRSLFFCFLFFFIYRILFIRWRRCGDGEIDEAVGVEAASHELLPLARTSFFSKKKSLLFCSTPPYA